MELSRTDERTRVMQCLYQVFLFLENNDEFDATEIIVSQYHVDSFKEVPVFSRCVYSLALEHFDEIKEEISKHLVNWTFDRINDVSKAILFLACAEGCYARLAPRKVVITEAVKMAKNYLKEGDHRFVNAVLEKAIPQYEFNA